MHSREVFLKLLIALILSGLIGLERERSHKPAGLRTNILVGVGSTLIMLCALWISAIFPEKNIDPSRIAAQVIVGIGFLGGGVIIQAGGSVHGLTTAACLWVISAVGMAVGMGFYSGALCGTGFALLSLVLLNRLDGMLKWHGWTLATLQVTADERCMHAIEQELRREGLKLIEWSLTERARGEGEVRLRIKDIPQSKAKAVANQFWGIEGVKKIEWS